MKKRIFTVLLAAIMAVNLVARVGTAENNVGKKTEETPTGQSASKEATESEVTSEGTPGENAPEQMASDEKASGGDAPGQSVVKWNCGTSGNVLLTIAEEKGYLKDEGITIERVEANANVDVMTSLATGKVGAISDAGTSDSLQQITSGVDLTAFRGHMVEDCMSVAAKAGAEWNGIESFIGKKVAANPSYFVFTGVVMDLGYDNLPEAVDWEVYSDYNDALTAVIRGDIKYMLTGTGQNLAAQEMAKNGEIGIVSHQSETMENYFCRRMEGQTQWVKDSPNTVKVVIRALLRVQSYYESDKEKAVKLYTIEIRATEEHVTTYMLDDEHYLISVDPLKNPVKRVWDISDKTGFLDEKAGEININNHINTKLYKEALGEATEAYGGEAPEFYQDMKTSLEENNKQEEQLRRQGRK